MDESVRTSKRCWKQPEQRPRRRLSPAPEITRRRASLGGSALAAHHSAPGGARRDGLIPAQSQRLGRVDRLLGVASSRLARIVLGRGRSPPPDAHATRRRCRRASQRWRAGRAVGRRGRRPPTPGTPEPAPQCGASPRSTRRASRRRTLRPQRRSRRIPGSAAAHPPCSRSTRRASAAAAVVRRGSRTRARALGPDRIRRCNERARHSSAADHDQHGVEGQRV